MLEAFKFMMTLNGALSGYKTYAASGFAFLAVFSGWGIDVVVPWMDGQLGMVQMISLSSPYFAQMGAAFGLAGLRHAA